MIHTANGPEGKKKINCWNFHVHTDANERSDTRRFLQCMNTKAKMNENEQERRSAADGNLFTDEQTVKQSREESNKEIQQLDLKVSEGC